MSQPETPSAKLAARVVDRLIEAKLMRADKRDQLIVRLSTGTMKGEDWKLEIDLATAKDAKP